MKATILAALMILFSRTASCQQKATAPVTVCVQASTLKLAPATLPQASIGVSYSASLADRISGGTAPYTWAVTSGTLPAGITLSTTNGVLSGTPTITGNFTFSVTVTDSSVSCPATTTANHQRVTLTLKTAI